jgi:Tfp pilus assembly protein PilP
MKYAFLTLMILLAGCSHERVKDLGEGMHSVSACADDRLINSQVTATRAADKFCEKSGREAVVDTFETQECPNADGAATRVVFACR